MKTTHTTSLSAAASSGIIAAASLLALPVSSPALVEVAEGSLLLHVDAVARYDTNIFANANDEDDFYGILTPSLQYLREAGLLNLDAQVGVDLIRFVDFDSQDTEDLFTSLRLSYPNRPDVTPLVGTFDIGWRERSATNEALGARTESEVFNGGLSLRQEVSEKLAVRGTGGYRRERFETTGLSTVEGWLAGLEGVHAYSDKLEVFGGYRYRNTDTTGTTRRSVDIDDHLVHVGAEGQILPKVVGQASVGVQQRRFSQSDLSNITRPYGTAAIDWAPRERSTLTLIANKDFDLAPDDRSVDNSGVTLLWNQEVYTGVSVEPLVSYTNTRFRAPNGDRREDDSYSAGVGLIYDFAGGASAALRYSYTDRDSTDAFFEYDRHVAELSGRITF